MAKDKKNIQEDQVDNEPEISENIVSEETQEKAIEESNSKKDKKKGGKSRIRVDFKSISPKRLYSRFKSFRRRTKFILVGALLFVLSLAILLPLGYVYKLDSYIFPSKLSGTVVSVDDEFIDKAKVCVQDKCKVTDENGEYVIEGLKRGKYDVSIFKEGYREYGTSVELTHGDNSLDIELQIQGYMSFSGMIQSADGDLMVKDFTIVLGENTYPVEIDELGNFVLESVAVETEKGYLSTPNYMDISFDIDPSKPSMDLGTMDLEKAFDLVLKPVNWINDQPIEVSIRKKDAEEDLEQSQIEDTITVRDLPFQDEELILEVSSDGYISKEVKVKANTQGTFENGVIGLVKEGKVVYKSNRTGNDNLYIANYDGSGETRLTDDKGDSISGVSYYPEIDKVYFLSDREGEKNENGNSIYLVYLLDVNTKKISKVSKTLYEDNDNNVGSYSYVGNKRVYQVRDDNYYYNDKSDIYVGNLDGTSSKKFLSADYYISRYQISPDGKYLVVQNGSKDNEAILYNLNSDASDVILSPKENETGYIQGFSPDSKKALFEYRRDNSDLFVRDFIQGKLIQVTDSVSYEHAMSFSSDSESVAYISNRDGKANLFTKTIEGDEERQLTNIDTIEQYAWQNGLIYYMNEGNMYVLDPNNPVGNKLVTNQGSPINSSYYGYGW